MEIIGVKKFKIMDKENEKFRIYKKGTIIVHESNLRLFIVTRKNSESCLIFLLTLVSIQKWGMVLNKFVFAKDLH